MSADVAAWNNWAAAGAVEPQIESISFRERDISHCGRVTQTSVILVRPREAKTGPNEPGAGQWCEAMVGSLGSMAGVFCRTEKGSFFIPEGAIAEMKIRE